LRTCVSTIINLSQIILFYQHARAGTGGLASNLLTCPPKAASFISRVENLKPFIP
jgi:hypothetical protein